MFPFSLCFCTAIVVGSSLARRAERRNRRRDMTKKRKISACDRVVATEMEDDD